MDSQTLRWVTIIKKTKNFKSKNLLVCESGLPVPDIVTVVKPEDDELVTWFILAGTVTPGGGWSGSTEDRPSFLDTPEATVELLSELELSLSFVDGTDGCVACFCKWKQYLENSNLTDTCFTSPALHWLFTGELYLTAEMKTMGLLFKWSLN